MERQIKPVENNNDKAFTYRQMKGRYNKAMSEQFYFEAIMIDYAMIEDRMRSFLYHIGVLETRDSVKLDVEETKKFHLELFNEYTNGKNSKLNLKNISIKCKLAHAVLNWVATTEGAEGRYQQKLKFACESLDIADVFDCFSELEKWCGYRNEIIHGLMNKNMVSLNSELTEKAEQGMQLATRIDSYVSIVKKGHTVRQSINLKTE